MKGLEVGHRGESEAGAYWVRGREAHNGAGERAKLTPWGLVRHGREFRLYPKSNRKPLLGCCQRTGTISFIFKGHPG